MLKIVFEFAGGPWDGKTVAGGLEDEDEARHYYMLSYHGRVGQRFRTASPYAISILSKEWPKKKQAPHHFHQHIYEITHREEMGEEVYVRAAYVEGRRG